MSGLQKIIVNSSSLLNPLNGAHLRKITGIGKVDIQGKLTSVTADACSSQEMAGRAQVAITLKKQIKKTTDEILAKSDEVVQKFKKQQEVIKAMENEAAKTPDKFNEYKNDIKKYIDHAKALLFDSDKEDGFSKTVVYEGADKITTITGKMQSDDAEFTYKYCGSRLKKIEVVKSDGSIISYSVYPDNAGESIRINNKGEDGKSLQTWIFKSKDTGINKADYDYSEEVLDENGATIETKKRIDYSDQRGLISYTENEDGQRLAIGKHYELGKDGVRTIAYGIDRSEGNYCEKLFAMRDDGVPVTYGENYESGLAEISDWRLSADNCKQKFIFNEDGELKKVYQDYERAPNKITFDSAIEFDDNGSVIRYRKGGIKDHTDVDCAYDKQSGKVEIITRKQAINA
ncbi:MAG: hypothetical protein IKU37_10180 [Candidatus Gastranaerophilales bacterium]|nr:hypothetical protein [Candidatus Gastranaerophilales bacterium]